MHQSDWGCSGWLASRWSCHRQQFFPHTNTWQLLQGFRADLRLGLSKFHWAEGGRGNVRAATQLITVTGLFDRTGLQPSNTGDMLALEMTVWKYKYLNKTLTSYDSGHSVCLFSEILQFKHALEFENKVFFFSLLSQCLLFVLFLG